MSEVTVEDSPTNPAQRRKSSQITSCKLINERTWATTRWFRWSGEVWAVSANSQLSFSILWFHCPIHVTCPNWQRTKTPISSSCKTTLRNRHVPLATCTFVACSQLQPFATGQIYKTSTQLQCVPSVTDAPRFETLKVSANDFSQCSWSVGFLKETRTNWASCRWNLQTRASFGLAECGRQK